MKENDNVKDYSDFIKELAKTLKDDDLSEIEFNHDLKQSVVHIKVTRNKEVVPQTISSHHPIFVPNSQNIPNIIQNQETSNNTNSSSKEATDLSKHSGAVLSPMVGIVYTRSGPDTEDFVKIGDTVKEGDVVLLIEAMKVFNPVKAPKAGKVTQILVKSNQPIEYGEVLLIIE